MPKRNRKSLVNSLLRPKIVWEEAKTGRAKCTNKACGKPIVQFSARLVAYQFNKFSGRDQQVFYCEECGKKLFDNTIAQLKKIKKAGKILRKQSKWLSDSYLTETGWELVEASLEFGGLD